jgi:uncharacterized protein YegP (UPF0339 family)
MAKKKFSFHIYKTSSTNQWYWRLSHKNGNIMADCGEGYRRKADCRKAIYSIIDAIGASDWEISGDG